MRFIKSGLTEYARQTSGCQVLIAAAFLCAALAGSTWAQTPTAWTNTSGGVWSDVPSWSNGVPDANDAHLTLTGVDYTVAYDAPATAFRDLIISNSAVYTSTLTIASTAFAPVRNVLLSSGAVVNVNAGGVWSPTLTQNVSLEVKAGAALNIAGGSILYTNMPQTNDVSLILSDSNARGTSVLNLTSGQLELRTTNATTYSWTPLSLGAVAGKTGIMNISGGKCVIQTDGHNSSVNIGMSAGAHGCLNITGGELVITNVQGGTYLGPYVELGYSGGGYGEINISGDGKFTKMNYKAFWVGQSGEGHINVNGGQAVINGDLYVGCRGVNGTGIVEVTAGELWQKGPLSLGVEGYSGNMNESGILNVYGGTVRLDSLAYVGWSYTYGMTNKLARITVTNGTLYAKSVIYVGMVGTTGTKFGKASGELNLSGSGVITNESTLYAGYGTNAVGVISQTGGTFDQNVNSSLTVIGEYGGNGTFNMSGGLFKNKGYVYVGGVNGFNNVGALNISGGTFQLYTYPLCIGEAGTGTLSMIGSQGVLSGSGLTATTATSKISFDLGTNGAGTVTMSGAVAISTNTVLDISVSNYNWQVNGLTVDLISYGTLTGTFGADKVTINGARGGLDGGTIIYGDGTSDKIQLQLNRRSSGAMLYVR